MSDSDLEESNSETDFSEEERRRQKGKQRWSSESNNTRRSDDIANCNTIDLGFFTDQKLYKLFCEEKTKISTIKEPLMLLRHLKDYKLITDELYKTLENSSDDIDMYCALECIQKRGEKKIRKFWECVQKEHILQRYRQLSEIIATLKNLPSALNNGPSQKRKTQERFEDGGTGKEQEFKKRRTEGNSESNQAGPSSQYPKSQWKKTEHVERAYKNEPSKKAQDRTEDGSTGKKREAKKESSESSNQAGRSSQSTTTQKTPEHVKREEELDLWDRPKHKKWLPVTCGGKEALLDREALRGCVQQKKAHSLINKQVTGQHKKIRGNYNCIKYRQKMITPCQFEEMAGKERCKNWKTSILCQDKTIKYLLEKGILEMN